MQPTNTEQLFLALKEQFQKSGRNIEILEPNYEKADNIKRWGVPEDDLIGVIAYKTGGIVFDKWVRVLGSGERDIVTWNETLEIDDMVIIADDILGGLFALENDIMHYFAPDTLEWESLDITYTQFIRWLIEGDVDKFYEPFRWKNWNDEVADIDFSHGISFYPFLWTKSESERHRKTIPLKEIVLLSFDMEKQLKSL